MKNRQVSKWLMAIFILMAGLSFTSCSDDDDNPVVPPVVEEEEEGENEGEGEDEEVVNPAGDDFYMYVNREWHQSVAGSDKSCGYSFDLEEKALNMTTETFKGMEEAVLIAQALSKVAENQEEAEEMVESIINEITSGIKTKDDAFRAIGKCINLGLVNMFKPYLAYDESVIGYCLYSEESDEEESDEEEGRSIRFFKKVNMRSSQRLSPETRASNTALNNIIEGMGLNPDYYFHDKSIDKDLSELNGFTKGQLVTIIRNSIEEELLPYCADEYANEITGGAMPNTEKFVINTIWESLFYPHAYKLVENNLTTELKDRFKEYAEELRTIFAHRIENNKWLSAESKQFATDKLAKMKMFLGEPEQWFEEGFPKLKGENMLEDILEIKKSRIRLFEAMQGLDKSTHSMTLAMYIPDGIMFSDYNAFYSSETNALHILPAVMLTPDYGTDKRLSENYAALYVIGHEMTHGFDSEGALYDASGIETDWMTAEDKEKFNALNNSLIEQISTFEVAPGIMADGQRTVMEDVADLGGLNIAYDALNARLKKEGITSEEDLKAERENFFLRYAYIQRASYSAEELQELLQDEHSIEHIRVNGIVQHMDSWYDLFSVTERDSLYLPAAKRVTIW